MYLKNEVGCVDFDDYCDATVDELVTLAKLKDRHPSLLVTLFTIPRRTSEKAIKRAKRLGDWVQLAPHGWRHTRGECLGWTAEEAKRKIELARDMGIDAPVFRAPAWLLDGDVYEACRELGYTVASHEMFRVPNTGVPEYIYNSKRARFTAIHGHVTPVADNYIGDKVFAATVDKLLENVGSYSFPWELANVERRCAS